MVVVFRDVPLDLAALMKPAEAAGAFVLYVLAPTTTAGVDVPTLPVAPVSAGAGATAAASAAATSAPTAAAVCLL
jgi:hypothetical protein